VLAQPQISVANFTTIAVQLVVNGVLLSTVPPGTREDPIEAVLPPRPWAIEARSPSGRVLATLSVGPDDYITNSTGTAVREDLACGRLDVWSGPPLLGPTFIPDPAKPCD